METAVPDKLFLKIGEVSELTSLRPSVLRFWESEFPELSPKKSKSGQRLYSKTDVEAVMLIKHLLYAEKLTIEGARHRLASSLNRKKTEDRSCTPSQLIADVVAELKIIRSML